MTQHPTHVSYVDVLAALKRLGIEHDQDNICSVTIEPRCVTIVRLRRDANGSLFAAGENAATVTTEIGVTE